MSHIDILDEIYDYILRTGEEEYVDILSKINQLRPFIELGVDRYELYKYGVERNLDNEGVLSKHEIKLCETIDKQEQNNANT